MILSSKRLALRWPELLDVLQWCLLYRACFFTSCTPTCLCQIYTLFFMHVLSFVPVKTPVPAIEEQPFNAITTTLQLSVVTLASWKPGMWWF